MTGDGVSGAGCRQREGAKEGSQKYFVGDRVFGSGTVPSSKALLLSLAECALLNLTPRLVSPRPNPSYRSQCPKSSRLEAGCSNDHTRENRLTYSATYNSLPGG